MMGTSTPKPRTLATISGTAAAAASLLTVTRTSSEPAWASRATWIAVASASAVSVFVIDWTTIGWSEPTLTPATSTVMVDRRIGLPLTTTPTAEHARWSASGGGFGHDLVHWPPPTWRAMSKNVIQTRKIIRKPNPTK